MTQKVFYIKLGDRLPVLEAVLTDENGDPFDLSTAAHVKFAARRTGERGPAPIDTENGVTVVAPATDGKVRYAWQDGDTEALGVGDVGGEFQVELADGRKATFPSDGVIPIQVVRDIAS